MRILHALLTAALLPAFLLPGGLNVRVCLCAWEAQGPLGGAMDLVASGPGCDCSLPEDGAGPSTGAGTECGCCFLVALPEPAPPSILPAGGSTSALSELAAAPPVDGVPGRSRPAEPDSGIAPGGGRPPGPPGLSPPLRI